jgi:hypothetical protein
MSCLKNIAKENTLAYLDKAKGIRRPAQVIYDTKLFFYISDGASK